jgi:hypothetical protein
VGEGYIVIRPVGSGRFVSTLLEILVEEHVEKLGKLISDVSTLLEILDEKWSAHSNLFELVASFNPS